MTGNKRFTWLKKDVYAPQIVITDSLTEKDLTPTDCYELLNELYDENEQLKQRINSRLHFYRGLYESTNDKVVERIIEDLEDILKR